HRVPRIHREIHDDLLDLARISFHCPNLSARYHAQVNVLTDHASKHLEVLGHDGIQIQYLRGQDLLATEGKKLSRKGSGTLGGIGNLLDGSPKGNVGANSLQQEFAVAGDHHQQVVEVVCDSSREAAHGFHLLRLP